MKAKHTIKRLFPYLKPYRWKLLLAIFLVIGTNVLLALDPMVEGLITTRLMQNISDHTGVDFAYVIKVITLLCISYLTSSLGSIAYHFLFTNAIQDAMKSLREAVEQKIRRLPIAYFDTHAFGDILSRVTNDVDTISNALQQALAQILNALLGLSFAIFMMFTIHPVMALLALLIIPSSVYISRWIVKKSQPLFEKQQHALGNLNGIVQEKFTGFHEIKLFGKEEDALQDFKVANQALCDYGFRAQFISGLMNPLVSFVTYLGIGISVVAGALFVMQGVVSIGNLQAFVRYIWQINTPLSQMTTLSSAVQASLAAVERVFTFLDEEEEEQEVKNVTQVRNVKGNVQFDHLHFGYCKDNLLLKDVNANMKSGQMVAIVGPTGVGKTTLINLLMRFYDVTSGAIRIDGIDIKDMRREDVRAMFGMVLQDTWLFHGTIKENIAYGVEHASDEEIIEAAKVANVHHFIQTLPDGYDMVLNEEANNISQGEKQLLTIARAVLSNPAILILDEATSSVDTRLEQLLQTAMRNVMKGRTSFVIAHRLSTIRNADVILVMKAGNIIEQGKHEELMSKHGFYEQLYNAQFAHLQD